MGFQSVNMFPEWDDSLGIGTKIMRHIHTTSYMDLSHMV